MTTLAADIGGTHMRAALVDEEGLILERRTIDTPHHSGVPDALTGLLRSVSGDDRAVSVAVVGLPGPIDYRSGRLLWAPHLPESWPDQLSEEQLSDDIGIAVMLANDADMAAVGEAYLGAGQRIRDVAYVTISTGVGAGLVFDGRLVHGDRSIAEIGHTIIDSEAWEAGLPATLEQMASGSGLTRLAAGSGLGSIDGAQIETLADAGNPDAVKVLKVAVNAAAIGLINLNLAFAPQVVVLGGGLGRQPRFFSAVDSIVQERSSKELPPVPLVTARLGDDAGLVGASRWRQAVG